MHNNINYKKIITIMTVVIAALTMAILIYQRAQPEQTNEKTTVGSEISTDDVKIKESITASFGRPGFPVAYTYPRPFDLESETYKYNEDWLLAYVDLLDEPPQSNWRHLIYVIKKTGDTYRAVANSNFENTQTTYPEDVPIDLIEEISEIHG